MQFKAVGLACGPLTFASAAVGLRFAVFSAVEVR